MNERLPLDAVVLGDEALISIEDYARYFGGHLRAHQRRAKNGRWKQARKLAGRWYVIVETKALTARLTAKATLATQK